MVGWPVGSCKKHPTRRVHLAVGSGEAVAQLSCYQMTLRGEVGAPVGGVCRTCGGSHLLAESAQKTQSGLVEPGTVCAMDERNKAAGIGQGPTWSSGVEARLILSSRLKRGRSRQRMVTSGSDLQVADSGDSSGADSHQISPFSVAAQEGDVLFSLDMPASTTEKKGPSTAQLVVAA